MITASLKNYRIAPRKFRLVADMIRGKSVTQAKIILAHAAKKGRHPLSALLDSAVANAKNNYQIDGNNLKIKEIRVDQGFVLKRFMPVSRGMAHGIKKRTSHVKITLAPEGEMPAAKKTDTKAEAKTASKSAEVKAEKKTASKKTAKTKNN